jgi:hypothetical protein
MKQDGDRMKQDRIERSLRTVTGALGALMIFALAGAPLCAPLCAQTHKLAKPETVVRAIGVYEWTGDMAKPAASRLIPVSLFIEGKLVDAAVYQARPVPFALLTGNVYELYKAGIAIGTLDLAYARHLVASAAATTTYDDGWFGYGKFVPPAVAKNKSTLKPSKTLSAIVTDEDDSKPHFSSKSATPGSGGAATPAPGTTTSTGTPADDPDRPTMRRHSDASDKTASSGSSSPADTPADDPDRPTLKRRSADSTSTSKRDQPSVTSVPDSLTDDPNRPLLHRGKPVGSMTDTDIPKLSGLPGDQDLHQIVAVSDAADRPPHDFSRAWDDEPEHQAILGKMQSAARAQLAAYEAANGAPSATPHIPPNTPRATNKSHRTVVKQAPPPPPEALLDEDLKGYTLSYGGAATYVYFAHTDGLGPTLRYVTLVAQINMQNEPQIAMKNVTDATHLDRTPRMRLVDVVDAEASNRASLLFELRAHNSRQFALYRVIGARADQTFITGSTP